MKEEGSDRHLLVTVGIKCFNQKTMIGEAIESALAQTYRPLEIVISDDGSTDGSWQVIEETVREYARSDISVTLNRNSVNLGNWFPILAVFEKG